MSDDHILYSVVDGVAVITLNRPERMNAGEIIDAGLEERLR